MAKRIVRALSLTLGTDEGRSEHVQGDEVDIPDSEVERLEASNALVPEGFKSFDEFHDQQQDAYRAGRGDILAGKRLEEARSGGIETISETPGAPDADVEQFAAWIRDEKPTVDEVIEMAKDDPTRAQQLLDAENLATGQNPRAGVEQGLGKIASGGE